ncbi:MAG TPA: superinfection immunity protein [Stellaceae bacterium]|nr:superinfection immunity protein [Stellaceae bacterium]
MIMATGLALFYLLPTLIAYGRDIPQRHMIVAINLLFGWTVIGWIIGSIWAMNAEGEAVVLLRSHDHGV